MGHIIFFFFLFLFRYIMSIITLPFTPPDCFASQKITFPRPLCLLVSWRFGQPALVERENGHFSPFSLALPTVMWLCHLWCVFCGSSSYPAAPTALPQCLDSRMPQHPTVPPAVVLVCILAINSDGGSSVSTIALSYPSYSWSRCCCEGILQMWLTATVSWFFRRWWPIMWVHLIQGPSVERS